MVLSFKLDIIDNKKYNITMPIGYYKRSKEQIDFLKEISKRPRHTRVLKDIKCPVCKKTFRPSNSKTKYCSRLCAMKNIPKKGINKQCIICGKNFYVRQCYKESKYCSRECQHKGLEKYILIKCNMCGIEFKKHRNRDVKNSKHNFCSRKCSYKYTSEFLKGNNNPLWREGSKNRKIYRETRNSKEYKEWRLKVFERDNWTCQDCGQHGGYLYPYHIKQFAYYPELRFEVYNGMTLRLDCHYKIHGKKHTLKNILKV